MALKRLDKRCITHMRLVVLTEKCKSMSSQSGRQAQSDSVVALIALLALEKGFCNTGQHADVPLLCDQRIEAPACIFCVSRVLGQVPLKHSYRKVFF